MSSNASLDEDGQSIDLARLFRALIARKRWILGPSLGALALSLAYVEIVTPKYTGVAKVLIENQEGYFTKPDKASGEAPPPLDAEAIASQVETLTTPDVARKLADRLKLSAQPEFNPAIGGLSSIVAGLFGSSDPAKADGAMVDAVLSRLTVFAQSKSRVMQVEFVSKDPQLAARGANAVAEIFLENSQAAKQETAKAASEWLAKKIETLRTKVIDAGAKVEAFRTQAGLLQGATESTVSGQQLTELNTRLAEARASQAEANAKAQTLRALIKDGRFEEVPDVAKDESLRRLLEQRTNLRGQMASLSKTLLPQHPQMRELAAQLGDLENEIKNAALRAVKGFESDARTAGLQVEDLNAALGAQSKTVASGNEDDVQLRSLELDEKAARDQLESYVEKYREASARDAEDASPPDARIISVATPPRAPTFPQKGPIVVLSTLAAFLLACGAAATQALLSDAQVARPEPTREPEPQPQPESKPQQEPIAKAEAAPPTSSPDRDPSLAQRLDSAASLGQPLLVAFGGVSSERALAEALTLARSLARAHRAVLVDCGEAQDWLWDTIDHGGETQDTMPGLAELSRGEAGFASALHPDVSSDLDIVPRGSGVIDRALLPDILDALSDTYGCVLMASSDWRSAEFSAAVGRAAVAILVGAPADVEVARAELAAAHARDGLTVLMHPSDRPMATAA